MRFPYRRYPITPSPAAPENEHSFRPVIPFRLIGQNQFLDLYGLLDTGADETYITGEMAQLIGVTATDDDDFRVHSASGEMTVRYADVQIYLEQEDEQILLPVTVGIIDQPWDEAILGHIGFLEYFTAQFNYRSQQVNLLRNRADSSHANG